jgi:hypothetical protein
MYYYVNDPTDGTTAGEVLAGAPLQEQLLNERAKLLNSRFSNIGADNPAKTYPLPRSLFYDAAKLDPDVKQAEKNGLFMFYSFGSGEGNQYLDQYYLSERPEYNRKISSVQSKNPTAYQLVKDTAAFSELLGSSSESLKKGSPIIGGTHAPYYWKDFIYCKNYGTIPNNRLITLRRFTSPVLDNFSIPKALQTPENIKKGIGMPVAQAITWFGGNTGNTLSSLIGFSTGLEWTEQNIDEDRIQKAFGDGLLGSAAYDVLTNLVAEFNPTTGDVLKTEKFPKGAEAIATALSSEGDSLTRDRYFRAFFDAVKSDTEGRFGILSERIWVPVDVIKDTQKRTFGLSFTWEDLVLKFVYDLTSAGEVNTKAAMFDIMANLLSIGTNYGNFLTPYIRYDSTYSALTFPGGDEGAKQFYTNMEAFVVNNASKMFLGNNSSGKVIGGQDVSSGELNNFGNLLAQLQSDLSDGKLDETDSATLKTIFKGIQSQLAEAAATDWQAPLSLYTGAPIGEWHVVIGNPYNPIAMIGNLICTGIDVSFNDSLGPDDFPTTIEATITLKHGRSRERGEIESIFNRGDGRLYQSVKSTSANAQTYNTVVDLAGQVSTNENINQFFNPSSGVPGSESPVTIENITVG